MVGALLEKAEECRYVKLHDAFRLGADGAPLLGLGRARGAVYLIRDPRDVAISLAHHNGSSIDAAIRLLNSPDGALADKPTRRFRQLPQVTGDWSGHVDGWMGQSSLPLHAIRYEDLLADTAGILSKALRFLDIEADPARIGRAVRFADFQELRRQERAEPFVEGWAKSSAPFFRSGRAGAWREVLSDAQSAAIEAAHGPVMRRFGYGV
jgi:aryl sulfotransferase